MRYLDRIRTGRRAKRIGAHPTIDLPSSWGASWHEHYVAAENPANGHVYLTATQGDGTATIAEFTKAGVLVARHDFTPTWRTRDDHNGEALFFPAHPSSPRLVIASTGHGSNYAAGQSQQQLRWQNSPDGNLNNFAAEVITTLASGRPNYSEWVEDANAASAGYGRAVRFWNDDSNISWEVQYTDDNFATYKTGRRLLFGGPGQVYINIDLGSKQTIDPAGTAPLGEYVQVYCFPNVADTGGDGQYIRTFLLNLRTGALAKPSNGNSINSAASIFATTGLTSPVITANVSNSTSLDTVRIPSAGRAQRFNHAHANVLCITDTPGPGDAHPYGAGLLPSDPTGARHIVIKAGVEYDLGGCGYPFYTGGYCPDIKVATESHSGDRIYRCVNDGSSAESGAKLLRVDYASGIAAGSPVVTTVLEAGVTPSIPSNYGIYRYFPVFGTTAASGELCGFAWCGTYNNSYTGWTNGKFVPVYAP
jgi:hypothetical protein